MTDSCSETVGSDSGIWTKGRTLAQILFSIAFVAVADGLFYGHPVGWTLGAYGALTGAGVIVLGGLRFRNLPSVLLGVCFWGLCLRAVIDPEPLVVVLGLSILVALALTLREGWTWSLARWCSRYFQFFFGMVKSYVLALGFVLVLPFAPAYAVFRAKQLRAWLIPLLLGCVFLGIFALANPVISLGLSSVGKGLEWLYGQLPSFISVPRALFWLTVGALLWTLLRCRIHSGVAVPPPLPSVRTAPSVCERFLTPEVIRNALIVFNALFAVQTVSDLWYLWGGGVLPQGMTHAEYAHRGAYPLVATALLAAAFVLMTFREGSPSLGLRTARCLVYVWLVQNVFLVVSAGWRLWLYVTVFSLSRLRLAAGVWMFLVTCGLVWIILRILADRSNVWLIKVNALTVLVALLCYSFWTPKMFIAGFNVRHCREAGGQTANRIDLKYLESLGYDALPALVWLERQVRERPASARSVRPVIDRLAGRLNERLSDWRGVTVKRWYLSNCLSEEVRLEQSPTGTPDI